MKNIVDFNQFKTLKELQDFTERQHLTISILQKENIELKDKIAHVEQLLNSAPATTSLAVGESHEELCKIEINRLYIKAQRIPLDMEEVKKFEIYTRSLLAIQGKGLDNKSQKQNASAIKKLSQQDLINLALQKDSEDDSAEQ